MPAAVPALIFTITAIPKGFPYHGGSTKKHAMLSKGTLNKVDVPGAVLLLLGTLALTAGFQEADSMFPWRSAYVITLLTGSGLLFITLLIWERYVTLASKEREPVLPWTFVTSRVVTGLLL